MAGRHSWKPVLAALAVIASPYAAADDKGWYGGISMGRSNATIDDAKISNGLAGGGLVANAIADDEHDAAYVVFGGYQFNRNFALEGGYFDLGKFSTAATTLPPGTLSGDIRLEGWNLDAVGTMPITDTFSVFGRLGWTYAQARDSYSGTGFGYVPNGSASKRDSNVKVGLGLQYAFTDSLGMRVEAERYRINDGVGNKGDVDLFSFGLVYRFRDRTPAPAQGAAAPEPAAAAPKAQVLAMTPPPLPAPTKVTFSADSLFDFGKATVKPEGQQALAQFAAELKGAKFDLITVMGHGDRIATHAYNMELTMRRAEAVKTYLVANAGIPAVKIAAGGTDGSDPVTKPGECKGGKASRDLIACLQPDRRVDVEVSGTR